ncbi:hypothetical protein K438DRAFT_1969600 [Mycena galopus ATCC 62051]|nr:hypothetical protein K438DRAFT_1969600 [Mycena galopus ATCC 62051]
MHVGGDRVLCTVLEATRFWRQRPPASTGHPLIAPTCASAQTRGPGQLHKWMNLPAGLTRDPQGTPVALQLLCAPPMLHRCGQALLHPLARRRLALYVAAVVAGICVRASAHNMPREEMDPITRTVIPPTRFVPLASARLVATCEAGVKPILEMDRVLVLDEICPRALTTSVHAFPIYLSASPVHYAVGVCYDFPPERQTLGSSAPEQQHNAHRPSYSCPSRVAGTIRAPVYLLGDCEGDVERSRAHEARGVAPRWDWMHAECEKIQQVTFGEGESGEGGYGGRATDAMRAFRAFECKFWRPSREP